MKNIVYKIIIPALIVILFFVFLMTSNHDVFVLILASGLMILLFNAYIHYMVFKGKNSMINELSLTLEETRETVRQKNVAEQLVIEELPMGVILFDDLYKIKWANKYAKGFIFQNTLEGKNLETISKDLLQDLKHKTDRFISKIYTFEYEVEVDYKNQIIYLREVTEREETKRKYDAQTDVVAVLNLDNLSDAVSVLDVSERSYIQGKYLAALEDWAEEFHFYLMPISTTRLVAIMNKENLQELIKSEFKILQKIASISKENELLVTLSSVIACSNIKLNKLGAIAEDALDLALSRGGDQVVVNIEGNDLMYFGGNTNTAEKRTRITTRINMQKLENLFESSNRVYIVPHKYPDTDAFGAAMGVLKMAHAFNKEAYIVIDQGKLDKSVKKIIQLIEYEYVTFLDYFVSVPQALDQLNREDMIVFVDHHSYGQSMDERLVLRTKNIAIIDHHRKLTDAIEHSVISHIEPYASSSVELVTEMIDLCSRDVHLNQFEATVMLSGIMVDTNNFMYRTGSRTFEAAAILRKFGADTFKVKNILREGLEEIQLRSQLLSLAEVVHKKFSIVIIPRGIDVTRTLLARVADLLLEIEDTVAAFAIGYLEDDEVGISARSLEGFNVQVIMEKFNGGGHLNNAGAQIKTEDIKKVRVDLLRVLNEAVMEEKPMKVILIKDLRGKGKKGDVIDVATGYGNFLLSNKTAIEATSENLQSIETENARKKEKERKLVEEMKELKTKIEQMPVKVFVKIGDNGRLFGKVSTKQVADEFKKQHGIEIDKRKIQLTDAVSSLGNHKVQVKLHKDVNAEIEVLVLEG